MSSSRTILAPFPRRLSTDTGSAPTRNNPCMAPVVLLATRVRQPTLVRRMARPLFPHRYRLPSPLLRTPSTLPLPQPRGLPLSARVCAHRLLRRGKTLPLRHLRAPVAGMVQALLHSRRQWRRAPRSAAKLTPSDQAAGAGSKTPQVGPNRGAVAPRCPPSLVAPPRAARPSPPARRHRAPARAHPTRRRPLRQMPQEAQEGAGVRPARRSGRTSMEFLDMVTGGSSPFRRASSRWGLRGSRGSLAGVTRGRLGNDREMSGARCRSSAGPTAVKDLYLFNLSRSQVWSARVMCDLRDDQVSTLRIGEEDLDSQKDAASETTTSAYGTMRRRKGSPRGIITPRHFHSALPPSWPPQPPSCLEASSRHFQSLRRWHHQS